MKTFIHSFSGQFSFVQELLNAANNRPTDFSVNTAGSPFQPISNNPIFDEVALSSVGELSPEFTLPGSSVNNCVEENFSIENWLETRKTHNTIEQISSEEEDSEGN